MPPSPHRPQPSTQPPSSTLPTNSSPSRPAQSSAPPKSSQPKSRHPTPSSSTRPSGPSQRPYASSESSRGRVLSYEELSRCFTLPINAAARELGVCVTALKKQCRKHNIARWPHRKLKSLDKLKEKLEKEEATAADKEYYKHEIHTIVQKKDHIFRANTAPPREASSAAEPSAVDAPTPSTPAPPDSRLYSTSHQHPHPSTHPPAHPSTPVLIPNHIPIQRPALPPSHLVHPQQALHAPPMPAVPIPGPHISLCGIVGCDCYMNNGISSQSYHPPLAPRPSAMPPNAPPPVSGGLPANTPQFYSPTHAQYPYPAHVAYPHQAPFHNMVQVNLLEQHPYNPTQQPQPQPPPPVPQSAQSVTAVPTSHSPVLVQSALQPPSQPPQSSAPTLSQSAPAYEVYAPPQQAATTGQPPYVYGGFPSQPAAMAVDNVPTMSQSNGTTGPQMVPHYWPDVAHASNPNNLVTMYNQTTHHHHHHPAESMANGHAMVGSHGVHDGTASSATHNSDAVNSRALVAVGAAAGSGGISGRKKETAATATGEEAYRRGGGVRAGGSRVDSVKGDGEGRPSEVVNGIANGVAKEKDAQVNGVVTRTQANGKDVEKKTDTSNGVVRGKKGREKNGIETANGAALNGNVGTEGEERRMVSQEASRDERTGAAVGGVRTAVKRGVDGAVIEGAERGWSRPYIGAGNTGVPVVLHGEREVTSGMREITPPSDREESPENAGGSGSGSGSGSGEGTGLGSGDGSGVGSGSGSGDSDEGGKENGAIVGGRGIGLDPPSPRGAGVKRRKGVDGVKMWREEGGNVGALPVNVRARRYEHMVHQCVSVGCAFWTVDCNFRVTLSVGSRVLLGIVGVSSHGRVVSEGEGREGWRGRYREVLGGRRLEWVVEKGEKRYLIVLGPFKKRGGDVAGVSGVIVEAGGALVMSS
eukprot:GFKZ01010928.1.p1 GENE.GFKZ01010928.1~~GFKZ01010928.1.p1  ORF type:complete len:924 (-),score=138.83 GFKZ01010928.1:283-3054(-)